MRQIERGAAQLLSGIRNHEKALRLELGLSTAEECQMADIRLNGFLIMARTRELSPTESRDLTEAAETVFGPDGMKRLLEGDLSQCQGESYPERARTALAILKSYENRNMDLTVPLQRIHDDLASFREAKAAEEEEKGVRARTVVIELTHNQVCEEGDVWKL